MSRSRPRRRLAVAAALVVALATGDGAAGPAPRPGLMRGMIVSCPTWGPIWGSPAMAESLAELRELGVEWIAIHPYARIERNGAVRFHTTAELDFLGRAVELSRAAGMRLFWKPHLAYWGSFPWRGAIDFGDDEAAWRRFFDTYTAFIVDQAAFAAAHGVELFAVGTETEATVGREHEWRRVIAAVREVYGGTLTYGANWDGVEKVRFWDALDLIGVQAYFPLAERDDPDADALWRAWEGPLATLARVSARAGGKPVVFTEIGYNRSDEAARSPWAHEVRDGPAARALRRRLIEVALRRAEQEPLVQGLFWWKWIPGDWGHDRDFSMRDPEAREALAEQWRPARRTTAQ